MKELPDIAITSYLGHKGRLDLHREQRARLNEMFGQINILSICSGYDADSAKALKGHNCLFLKYRKFKYQKHNSTLRHLYESEKPKAMLFLDDDVLPVKMPDLKTDPISVLSKWIESPDLMPSSCVYFSSKDLIWDVYYGKREEDIVICPFSIVGWAIMIRNDHQILYDKKALFPPGYTNPICDDIAFRTQCAAEGKEVVKHQKLFFETIYSPPMDLPCLKIKRKEDSKYRTTESILLVSIQT